MMDVICDECGKKASDTLGNILVAGWRQKNPEMTPSKRGWACPSCIVTIQVDGAGGSGASVARKK